MPTVADLRQRWGSSVAGLTDAEVIEKTALRNNVPVWQLAEAVGFEAPRVDSGGVIDSMQRGLGQLVSGTGSVLRDVSAIGDAASWLERQGRGIIERNPAKYNTTEDVMASPVSAFVEKAAEGVGQFAPALAALPFGGIPALGVAAASSAAGNVGETRSRQRELGQDTSQDVARAWGYGVPQVLLDVALGPEGLLLKSALKSGAKGLTEVAAREIAERGLMATAGRGALAGLQEAPQEVAQAVLGRMATKEALTGADATEEYLMSAFGGAAGGMTLGAGIAPAQRAGASKFVDQIDQARQTLDTPLPQTYEDVQGWLAQREQATNFLKGVTENDFGLQQAEAFAAQQVGAQRSILDEAAAQRQKDVDARIKDRQETQGIEAMYEADRQRQEQLSSFAKTLGELAKRREMPTVQPDMFPDVEMQGPPSPAAPQFDVQDQFRAALNQLQLQQQVIPPIQARVDDAEIAAGLRQRGAKAELAAAQAELAPLNENLQMLQQLSGYDPTVGFGMSRQPGQGEMFAMPKRPPKPKYKTPESASERTPPTVKVTPEADEQAPSKYTDIAAAAEAARAAGEVTPRQYAEVMAGIRDNVGINDVRSRLEEYRGQSRPADTAASEGSQAQRADVGRGVAPASAPASGVDVGRGSGPTGGTVSAVEPAVPVAAAPTQDVTQGDQNGLLETQVETPAPQIKEPENDIATKTPEADEAAQRAQDAANAQGSQAEAGQTANAQGEVKPLTALQERQVFGKKVGAVVQAGGHYLRGRQNPQAAKAMKSGDTTGVLDALSRSKNEVVKWVAEKARAIRGLKVAVEEGRAEQKFTEARMASETAKVWIDLVDALRRAAKNPGTGRLPVINLPEGFSDPIYDGENETRTLRQFLNYDRINTWEQMRDRLAKEEAELAQVGEDTVRRNAGLVGMQVNAVPGAYDAVTKTVYADGDYFAQSEEMLTHELTHALTVDAIENPTAAQRPVIAKLQKLLDFVKAHPRYATTTDDRGLASTKRQPYGLSSLQEFVAEGFGNPDFQQQLNTIPYESDTVWGKFTKFIAELIGVPHNTAFTEMMALTEELTNAVPEQGAAKMDVRQQAKNGQKVGKRNKVDEVPADQGQTEERKVDAAQAPEAPVSALQKEAQPKQPLQEREDALKARIDAVLADPGPLKASKKFAEMLRESLDNPDFTADPEQRSTNVAYVEKEFSKIETRWKNSRLAREESEAEDRAAAAGQAQANLADIVSKWGRRSDTGTAGNASVELVQGVVDSVRKDYSGLPEIEVVSLQSRTADERNAVGTTKGVYYSKGGKPKIYLFAENISGRDDAVATVFHEGLGHYGLAVEFGKDLDQTLQGILDTSPNLAAAAMEWTTRNPGVYKKDAQIRALEEILAEKQEAGNVPASVWERIRATIREWGRKFGLVSEYSEADIRAILRRAAEAARKGGVTPDTESRFSVAAPYSITSKQFPTPQQTQEMLAGAKTTMTDTVYNTALRHFATLGQLVDRAKAHGMKAPEKFEEVIGKIRRHEKKWTDDVIPVAAWWQSLSTKGNEDSVRAKFDTLLRESEALALRADKPLNDAANKWGVNRKWSKDEKPVWENEAQMKQMFTKLQRDYNALDAKGKANYTKLFDAGAKLIREHRDGVVAAVNRNIADPRDRKDIIAKVDKQWADAMSGRPWLPHRWYGDYRMEVNYKDGEREIISFDTLGQAKAARNALIAEGHDARYFKTEEFFSQQRSFSRSALNDIDAAIDKNLPNNKKAADALKRVVQEAYYSSMPETAGAQRLRRRKGTAGWERTDLARAWADSTTAMARMTAKMQNMDGLRDAVDDAKREAGERQGVYIISWWEGTGDDRKNFQAKVVGNSEDLATERNKHGAENFHITTLQPEEGAEGLKRAMRYAPSEDVASRVTAQLEPELAKVADTFKTSRMNSDELDARMRISRALQSRYEDMLEADSSHPVSSALTTAGFVYYLGWTPAFAIMNVMQVPMITAPRLAAKFGGMQASGALKRAYAQLGQNADMLGKLMKASVSSAESDVVDIEDMRGLTDGQKKMLVEMRERGRLDFTQDTEMNSLVRGTPVFLQRIVKSATWLAHPTEVGNRIVTALATYDLASKRGMSDKDAYALVQSVIDETQMNYSPENRIALLNNPVLRPVLQFKQFGQQMTYTLGKAMIQAALSKDAAVRKEQRAFLGYIAASAFLIAGAKGLPFMGTMLYLMSMLAGDDDEPRDLKFEMEEALGPLMANGLVGIYLSDWSKRVGLGDVLPIPGLSGSGSTAPQASRREKLQDIAFDALGPTGSIAAGFADALDAWDRGDSTAALTSAMPKALRDPLRAAKIIRDDGLTTKDGVIRVGGEDIGILDLMAISSGFKPSVEGETMRKANYLYAREKYAALRAALLVRQYDDAQRAGDDMTDVESAIEKFNAANDTHAITASRLKKFAAAKDSRQKYADMMGGLGFSKKSQAMAEELGLLD